MREGGREGQKEEGRKMSGHTSRIHVVITHEQARVLHTCTCTCTQNVTGSNPA